MEDYNYVIDIKKDGLGDYISHYSVGKDNYFENIENWFKHVVGNNSPSAKPKEILIYIHGYNSKYTKLIKRHKLLKKLNDITIVSFNWPSKGDFTQYDTDKKSAKETAHLLVEECILKFNRLDQNNIHLLGHSTGAYLIQKALQKKCLVDQVMFIGADIDQKSLAEDKMIYKNCNRLTNYSNDHDAALWFSEFLHLVRNNKYKVPDRFDSLFNPIFDSDPEESDFYEDIDKLVGENIKSFSDMYKNIENSLSFYKRVGRYGLEKTNDKEVNVNCSEYYDIEYYKNGSQRDIKGNDSHSWYISDKYFIKDIHATINNKPSSTDDRDFLIHARQFYNLAH
jgi:pimeloyl-ACP methyl ester carboxylesterase